MKSWLLKSSFFVVIVFTFTNIQSVWSYSFHFWKCSIGYFFPCKSGKHAWMFSAHTIKLWLGSWDCHITLAWNFSEANRVVIGNGIEKNIKDHRSIRNLKKQVHKWYSQSTIIWLAVCIQKYSYAWSVL